MHTCAHKRCHVSVSLMRSQIYLPWRAYSKVTFSVFQNIVSVWTEAKPDKKVALSNLSGLVWTGPQCYKFFEVVLKYVHTKTQYKRSWLRLLSTPFHLHFIFARGERNNLPISKTLLSFATRTKKYFILRF